MGPQNLECWQPALELVEHAGPELEALWDGVEVASKGFEQGNEGERAGDIFGAGPGTVFLGTAVEQWNDRGIGGSLDETDAPGTAELMGATGEPGA